MRHVFIKILTVFSVFFFIFKKNKNVIFLLKQIILTAIIIKNYSQG